MAKCKVQRFMSILLVLIRTSIVVLCIWLNALRSHTKAADRHTCSAFPRQPPVHLVGLWSFVAMFPTCLLLTTCLLSPSFCSKLWFYFTYFILICVFKSLLETLCSFPFIDNFFAFHFFLAKKRNGRHEDSPVAIKGTSSQRDALCKWPYIWCEDGSVYNRNSFNCLDLLNWDH